MYRTENELNHFQFEDAYVDDIGMQLDSFVIAMENVKILPENSCNRDIRLMRTNDLNIKIPNASITSIIEEGYKRYDADGKLLETVADKVIASEDYSELMKTFPGCVVYSFEKKDECYEISIDGEEQSYTITVNGSEDIEEWERFINI